MVSTQFGALLKEMEAFFKCPLEPDQKDTCLIKMGIGISIQIELDRYGYLLIGCRIGTLPMSRYRDNIIQQALKSNEAFPPSTGVFAFSQKANQLIFFLRLEPNVPMHRIFALLPSFISKAKKWTDALAKGETPSMEIAAASKGSGIFDLIS